MDFGVFDPTIAIVTFVPIVAVYLVATAYSPLGALSLPSITMLVSGIYFYLMPAVSLAAGDEGFYGMYISNMAEVHQATFLYAAGATLAFALNWRVLGSNPVQPSASDGYFRVRRFLVLWAIAVLGVAAQAALHKLNLTGDENYAIDLGNVGQLAFITQAFNLMMPLSLIFLIRDRFGWKSLGVLAVVLLIFLQAGFRFRIMILLAAAGTSFALLCGIRVRVTLGAFAVSLALVLVNVIGAIRRYGQGIDLSGLTSESYHNMFSKFGGEFGAVYVLDYLAGSPLPPPVYFEPWLVAIARLVPSFIWPDKPVAEYLRYFIVGATVDNADRAGIAGTQHAEILLQFGWWGLAPAAFLYFSVACLLLKAFRRASPEVRLACATLVPSFFGYYMQTRGYFFQYFADGLFTLGPLFLLTSRPARMPRQARPI